MRFASINTNKSFPYRTTRKCLWFFFIAISGWCLAVFLLFALFIRPWGFQPNTFENRRGHENPELNTGQHVKSLLEQSMYHKIYERSDQDFDILIYDISGEILNKYMKMEYQPHAALVEANTVVAILEVVFYAGGGVRNMKYFDLVRGHESAYFENSRYLGNGVAAYMIPENGSARLVLQNVFDENLYRYTIDRDFAAFAVTDALLREIALLDSSHIAISYYAKEGADSTIRNEIVQIRPINDTNIGISKPSF
jgi:hypothetical protein